MGRPVSIRRMRCAAIAAWLTAAALGAAAQGTGTNWLALEGMPVGAEVEGVWVDARGPRDMENFNRDDQRAYPLVPVLTDFKRERNAGLGGTYQSTIDLVALDCAGRRAQNVQTRLYAKPHGVDRTMIAGVLSLWKWDAKGATHPSLAATLFGRYCPGGNGKAGGTGEPEAAKEPPR